MTLRYLVDGWWHADDLETALERLRAALDGVGLPDVALPEALIEARTDALVGKDEEIARWHQLGIAAVTANAAFRARGASRRIAALGTAARPETDEPAWVVVESEAELAALRARYGAPDGLEAAFDRALAPDEVPADHPAALTPNPYFATLQSRTALAERRFADALALAEVGVADGSHGILAELVRIEALVELGRRDDALAAWDRSARAWLAGQRQAGDTQWSALARLHERLARPADELTARVAARARR